MGCGREVGAPWVTRALSATPNVRNQPTPAVTRTRGVGDAAPYGRVRDVGCSIVVNSCANAADFRPPLGSPERGAVAARSAVTEGLRAALVRRTTVAGQPDTGRAWKPAPTRRGEVCARNTTSPVDRRRAGGEAGWLVEPALSIGRRRRTGDGAPYDVWESISVKPTLSVIQRKGRRGRRPLRWLRDAGFSGAVR